MATLATITIAEGVASSLITKALELLAEEPVWKAASWWCVRDDLKKLENTIKMIKERVCDAEGRQEGENNGVIKLWLQRLKQVLYRAEDLFDQIISLDLLKQQEPEKSMLMLCEIGILFTTIFGSLCHNIKLAYEIKSIRQQLDDIKSDMDGLNLSVLPAQQLPLPRLLENRETSSVLKKVVIGRRDDKTNIITTLRDDGKHFTVIPIVGYGGLGKTTLAQLVFNDEEVQQHFNLTAWAHVPEKDHLKNIKGKILQAFTGENCHEKTLDFIERGIIKSIETKKYLLVLDDLWYEGEDIANDLLSLLERGKHGSKVIVTTQLDVVTKQVESIAAPYNLGTLTDVESRELFQNLALGPESNNAELRLLGEDIVKMCGNVPLAIVVVAGSLKSKHNNRWLKVKNDLSKASLAGNDKIMATLKLSYDYLPLASRLCFAYCSLFPKGYEFEKDDLVHLWMAQGYVQPDNGDTYFWNLVARNLFQCVTVKNSANTRRYIMHDLLHDLAQAVAGDEMLGYERPEQIHDPNRLIHVYADGSTCPSSMKNAKRLRSLLNFTCNSDDENLFSEFQSLRVLSIDDGKIHKLPNSIGRLIHLRYLNLRMQKIERLPDSITRLVNLQTLNLKSCYLKELPREFARLVNLRHLLLPGFTLTDLPSGFEKLTCLQELDMFIVGNGNGIDSLRAWNLGGKLEINFRRWREDAIEEAKKASLKDIHQLTSLSLHLGLEEEEATPVDGEMNEMLNYLQLPPELKDLWIWEYKGSKLPSGWFKKSSKLDYIYIRNCISCKALPHLSWLPGLNFLTLFLLIELEYIEDADDISVGSATQNECFQSLEELWLVDCYKLQGWTRASKDDNEVRHLVFPSLLKLNLNNCPMLMCMPLAPKLLSLRVRKINWKMVESNLRANHIEKAASSSSASTLFTSLKELHIFEVDDGLITLSISSSLCNLSTLYIYNCSNLKKLRFESSSSIQEITINECCRFENISEGLQHLSVLKKLDIYWTENLTELRSPCSNLLKLGGAQK